MEIQYKTDVKMLTLVNYQEINNKNEIGII